MDPAPTSVQQPTQADDSAVAAGPGREESGDSVSAPHRPKQLTLAERLSWTLRQRRGMAVLLGFVLLVLAWRAIANRATISDPQPEVPARYDELAARLDPNSASWQELVAIPSLGEKRAKAIVEHRQEWMSRHPGELPYHQPIDLAAVSGIGATMIEQMSPHLLFPPRATSQPSP